jgi:hypothetical protein
MAVRFMSTPQKPPRPVRHGFGALNNGAGRAESAETSQPPQRQVSTRDTEGRCAKILGWGMVYDLKAD